MHQENGMTQPSTRDMRLNEKLLHYWQGLRAERPLPLESDIDPEALREVWPSCFLVKVTDHGFAYDYVGSELQAAYADDIIGREISETLLSPHPKGLFELFQQVRASATPDDAEDVFVNSYGVNIRYRASVLPFAAKNREGVAFLLGGMRWKTY